MYSNKNILFHLLKVEPRRTPPQGSPVVESPGAHVDDCVSCGPFCLVPVFFSDSPPSFSWLTTWSEWGGMPSHDAVGINWKNGANAG